MSSPLASGTLLLISLCFAYSHETRINNSIPVEINKLQVSHNTYGGANIKSYDYPSMNISKPPILAYNSIYFLVEINMTCIDDIIFNQIYIIASNKSVIVLYNNNESTDYGKMLNITTKLHKNNDFIIRYNPYFFDELNNTYAIATNITVIWKYAGMVYQYDITVELVSIPSIYNFDFFADLKVAKVKMITLLFGSMTICCSYILIIARCICKGN